MTKQQDAQEISPHDQAALRYRAAPGGRSPDEWVVVSGTLNNPGPAVLVGFKTEKHAQEAADTLNELRDEGRTDEVLGRMMGANRSSP